MLKEKIIIGSGGCARDIKAHIGDSNLKFFVSDEFYSPNDENIHPLSSFNPELHSVMVGIGDPISKKKIVESLPINTEYWSWVSPYAILLGDDIKIGDGTFISAGVILTCNIVIGNHVLLNISSTVSHDGIIGDYSTISPSANICGNVTIGECCYIGANAVIKEKIKISDNVTVGLNAGVVSNLNKSGVYIGTPAKPINYE